MTASRQLTRRELDNAVKAFERAERKRAVRATGASLVLIVVALVTLAVILRKVDSAWDQVKEAKAELESTRSQLEATQRDLSVKKLDLESLSGDIDAKTKELDKLTSKLGQVKAAADSASPNPLAKDIKSIVARPAVTTTAPRPAHTPPVDVHARVRLSLDPTGRVLDGARVYRVRIWMDFPKAERSSLRKAEYFFNHSSFVPKLRTSFDGDNGFPISYLGYGCVPATATLVTMDNARHSVPFDMCALWGAAEPR